MIFLQFFFFNRDISKVLNDFYAFKLYSTNYLHDNNCKNYNGNLYVRNVV